MQYLFGAWNKLLPRLQEAQHVLLLSDFDGTLTPIVADPANAVLTEETRKRLQTIALNKRYSVGVISGRSLTDLKNKVGVEGILYAGNHGLEIEGPGFQFINAVAAEQADAIQLLGRELTTALGKIKGVVIENKGLTISVHYRAVADYDMSRLRRVFKRITGPGLEAGRIVLTGGKKVYEVRPPVQWGKGESVRWLIEKTEEKVKAAMSLLSIFMGDDLTDEGAFNEVEGSHGISIFVGSSRRHTGASYFVSEVSEVHRFLKML